MIRTRFAPSPTGMLHLGSVRTALFAWLLARHNSGQFILRIEDTDKVRQVDKSVEHIIETLRELNLDYDEGPQKGGQYGPYFQSQRLDLYMQWADVLVEKGRAYPDPYSKEEIENFRMKAKNEKKAFLYRDYRPKKIEKWDGTRPLRFKSDPKAYSWNDLVMGKLSSSVESIDDIILIKSDGYPTYNFAHIIDDHLMKISHVIRGQEFISSQPNYFNLYEALEFEKPLFATVPHILAFNGNKKLGKRDGAKDILEYLKEGYLVEALINFIAGLGWNDGTEQEFYKINELIDKFDISRVQRSGARFDEKKLLWLNGKHIRSLDLNDFYEISKKFLPISAKNQNREYILKVLKINQDRIKTLSDIPILTDYFFRKIDSNLDMIYSDKQLKDLDKNYLLELLNITIDELKNIEFNSKNILISLNNLLDKTNQKPNVLFSLIRICISWSPYSPALNDTLEVLGKKESIERLNDAIKKINNNKT